VNRQPITAQLDLARDIRVERDERDIVTAGDEGSDLGKWWDASEPCGDYVRLVE
jgi:hypothetical protein